VEPPFRLDFDQDHGGVVDGDGTGTGFTDVLPRVGETSYVPANIDAGAGMLRLRTTAGIQYQDANSLDNALGVGFPRASSIFTMATTLVDPPPGSRRYEQAGLWFGPDQENYAKLVLNSPPSKLRLEYTLETKGQRVVTQRALLPNMSGKTLSLLMRGDPLAETLTAWYAVGSDPLAPLATFVLPPGMFAPNRGLGTPTFGGIFATHRRGQSPLDFNFDDFRLLCHSACANPSPGDPGPFTGGASPRSPAQPRPGSRNPRLSARSVAPRRVRSRVLLKRGVSVRVWCSTACNTHSRLVARRGAARQLRSARSVTLGRATGGGRDAGRFKVRIRVSPSGARKIRRARKRTPAKTVSLGLSTDFTGAGGQAIKSHRRLVVIL
jgi:hypothetical protein